MKIIFLFTILLSAVLQAGKCRSKNDENGNKYKGRLEIKALCMNYTIKVLEGNIDTSRIAASWTDEMTGKSYTNVFALGSPCSFPSTIQEGDEFYFIIDSLQKQDCAVCLAYYPKPARKLSIKVMEK